MFIKYTKDNKTFVASIAPGITAAQAATAMGLTEWGEITAVEAAELQKQEPPTLDELKAHTIELIKEKSWQVETDGITLQDMTIPTDRESQSMITGAVVGVLLDENKITKWQTADVSPEGAPIFVDLDANTIKNIGTVVRNHVQSCFDMRDIKITQVISLETIDEVNNWVTTELDNGW